MPFCCWLRHLHRDTPVCGQPGLPGLPRERNSNRKRSPDTPVRWPVRRPAALANGLSAPGQRPSPMSARRAGSYVEHGLSYYPATKSMAPTPGHSSGTDLRFRTFDSTATALRCFQCHSTGTLTLAAGNTIQPSELGVRCESCHGPGARPRKGRRGSRNHSQSKAAQRDRN